MKLWPIAVAVFEIVLVFVVIPRFHKPRQQIDADPKMIREHEKLRATMRRMAK